jgi:phosphate transport system substrate-binding protein
VFRVTVRSFILAAVVCLCLSGTAQDRLVLVGSGSNLPIHLFQAWTSRFNTSNRRVQVQYMPLGSAEGIRQISAGIGDFAAGEILITDKEAHSSPVSLLAIPTVLVAIVPIYNLPGRPALNFSGELLAQIYLGAVKNWADPRIAALNADAKLPGLPIHVVHRSGGKGSNFIFTDFLSKTDAQFRAEIGRSASPHWPLGLEADRGQDMVKLVASTPGAIGYVELSFARNSDISYGRVRNAAGQFMAATSESVEAACTTVENSRSNDFRVSITNPPGNDSYPIASFTWVYVPTSGTSLVRRQALKEFLLWALRDGQKVAAAEGYTPLPDQVVASALFVVDAMP